MLPFLPDYSVKEADKTESDGLPKEKIKRLPLALTLFGIFLFQAANMGLFAYMIALGRAGGLTLDFMSPSLAIASWVGLRYWAHCW
jgi:hypothetical protein